VKLPDPKVLPACLKLFSVIELLGNSFANRASTTEIKQDEIHG
jgi:hypothetical protein